MPEFESSTTNPARLLGFLSSYTFLRILTLFFFALLAFRPKMTPKMTAMIIIRTTMTPTTMSVTGVLFFTLLAILMQTLFSALNPSLQGVHCCPSSETEFSGQS